MTKKTLRNLILLCVVLFSFYWLSMPANKTTKIGAGRQLLLSHISWSELGAIVFQKGDESLEVVADSSGSWSIPSKHSYPASASQLRSFILKLMDLSSKQSIEGSDTGIEKLGLSEESNKEKGNGIIKLKGKSGEVIETLYLGGLRTRKSDSPEESMGLSGQYLKLNSKDEVYLIPLPITYQVDVSSWIDSSILRIQQSQVYEAQVIDRSGEEEKELYSIKRVSPLTKFEGEPEFSLSISAPEGKEIEETFVRQISMGLEDLKAENVFKKDDSEVSSFKPVRSIKYSLTNGLVYEIKIQDLEGVHYLNVTVSKDENLIERIRSQYTKEQEAKEDPTPEIKDDKEPQENAPNEKPTIIEPSIINDDEVNKEKARLENWVYIVADFVGKKLLKDESSFFKDVQASES